MNMIKKCASAAIVFFAMGLLILDTKTALYGAAEGITLCLRTVIPSLFPFFVITSLLTGFLLGRHIPCLHPINRLLGIPYGAESLLAAGILGGYPVGAQCITQAYRAGSLCKEDAERMLGFCSNAGPAFLFGMIGTLFSSPTVPWVLWSIHLLSACTVGLLLPKNRNVNTVIPGTKELTLPDALKQSVRTMADVCGWIVLFRIVIAFFDRWFLWMLPKQQQILFMGLLELSNGCVALAQLPQEGLRFLLCGLFLGLGGMCVGMQTVSVTASLGTGMYWPGKLMQASAGVLLCVLVQPVLFQGEHYVSVSPMLVLVTLICTLCLGFFLTKSEKNSRKTISAHV